MNKETKETFENRFENVSPRQGRNWLKLILLVLSYVVLALIVWQVTKSHANPATMSAEQAQKELTATVKKVDKLMVLPSDETPQVAIIQDVEALKKSQEFFADAQNGDKILVYTKARKAIIYRDSTNKIVNVILNIGPVTDDTNTTPVEEKVEETKATTTTKTASSTTSVKDEQ
ncbi:MAG: hypothetical protein V4576_02115 [Patescibacteria group bacterium]